MERDEGKGQANPVRELGQTGIDFLNQILAHSKYRTPDQQKE